MEFNPFVVPENCLDFEVDANGRDEGGGEGVVGVSEEKGGFSHRRIADNQEFEHVVEVLVGSILLPPLVLRNRHLWNKLNEKTENVE